MLKRAEERRRLTKLDVEFLDLPGEKIPLPDASVDTIVSTFNLCTIPGVADAIRGLARVIRPGGQFLFFEHGLFEGGEAWQVVCSRPASGSERSTIHPLLHSKCASYRSAAQ